LPTLVLLGTGWWLLQGHEGQPTFLARWLDLPDVEIHRRAGWVLAGGGAAGIVLRAPGTRTLVPETLRADRGDGRWLAAWPRGVLTGRFRSHRGHFDPGQRIANVLFALTLLTVVGSGIALTQLPGGSTFALMVKIHRYATYVLTPLVI